MNILFYYPSNKRTISIESVILKFKEQGHNVVLLTQIEKGDLHQELGVNGVITYTHVIKKGFALFYYLRHLIFLTSFCRKHKVDIVYSHLQQANIISVFAQFFCKPKFYICRHHSSTNGADRNFNQSLFDKVINHLAKIIIVPSKMVYEQLCITEKVNPNKVKLIYYGYDFSKYPKPDPIEVEKIKNTYPCKLLLVKIARLVPGKRYDIVFRVLKKMILMENMDIKFLVISDGPLYAEFKHFIDENKLDKNIFLLGDMPNVINYLSAADAVPLLSESEASNSVIKEAGLIKKAVLICNDVGDFNDYISNGDSGLFMNKENPEKDFDEYINSLYDGKIDKYRLGVNLYKNVINTFSVENVISNYEQLNQY